MDIIRNDIYPQAFFKLYCLTICMRHMIKKDAGLSFPALDASYASAELGYLELSPDN